MSDNDDDDEKLLVRSAGPAIFAAFAGAIVASSYALIWHPAYRRRGTRTRHEQQRVVPSTIEQRQLRDAWLFAESTVDIDGEWVEFSHRTGNHSRLPRMFYESVWFGATSWRPGGANNNNTRLAKLVANETWRPWKLSIAGESAEGFLVQWKQQREPTEDVPLNARERVAMRARATSLGLPEMPPWHRVQARIERYLRAVDQTVLIVLVPHHFGAPPHSDPLRHAHILQHVVPTRTGFQHLRTTGVVWAVPPTQR